MEKLYKITYNNDGDLVNPSIESPTYIIGSEPNETMIRFLELCSSKYPRRQLSPNNIQIKEIVSMDDIVPLNLP